MRVRLTRSGRRLREKAADIDLTGACGLAPDQFAKLRREVVALRDNLVEAARNAP